MPSSNSAILQKIGHLAWGQTSKMYNNNRDIEQNLSSTKSTQWICRSIMTNLPIPKWVLMLAYLAVPVRFLFSLYGICWCVRASRYFLAKPKSMMYTRFPFFPSPMRKLSGFTSRWMKFLEWMYSILLIWRTKQKNVCITLLSILNFPKICLCVGGFVTELLRPQTTDLGKWDIKLKSSLPGMSVRFFIINQERDNFTKSIFII